MNERDPDSQNEVDELYSGELVPVEMPDDDPIEHVDGAQIDGTEVDASPIGPPSLAVPPSAVPALDAGQEEAVCQPSEDPEPQSADPAIERLTAQLADQSEQLESLSGSFALIQQQLKGLEERPVATPLAVQQIEQRLHALTTDGQVQAKRSLLKDVTALYDLAVSMGQIVDGREAMPLDEFRQRISVMEEQIVQMLLVNGLELIPSEPGTPFDSRMHCARQGVPCQSEDLHHTVKTEYQKGFRTDALVFRPAAVDVWIWNPSTEDTASEAADENADANDDASVVQNVADVDNASAAEELESIGETEPNCDVEAAEDHESSETHGETGSKS